MRASVGGCLVALTVMAAAPPSQAADMPARVPPQAPVHAPAYNWYGFFIGVHGGYLSGGHAVSITGSPALPAGIASTIDPDPSGFIGGIHWGTNWQNGRWVYGFDSDISFTNITGSQTIVIAPVTTFVEEKVRWFGTTRVRLGYTVLDNLLLYVTGGLAGGTARLTVTHSGFTGLVDDDTMWGWALGAGIEYGMGPWSLRLDYLHYDLGDTTFRYVATPTTVLTANTSVSGDIIRGGISYRFNWTPWELVFGRR
jgi:outer membrane immunogenic protein